MPPIYVSRPFSGPFLFTPTVVINQSPDIDENILAALNIIFTTNLITIPSGASDPLTIRTLKQADLQDDPTLTAPYLVYRPDIEKGVIPVPKSLEDEYGRHEIGGPVRFLHYYECKFGAPIAVTRAAQRTNIAILQTRIIQTLITYYDLANIPPISTGSALFSPDQTKEIEGANKLLIDKTTTRIFGGETTFYGEGHVWWHYPVSWYF